MRTLIVEQDGSLGFCDIPKPTCGPKEAVVKMIAGGMCGTDVKLIHKSFKGFPESIYPVMLGHEGVGEVVEIGADVKGYQLGDKVLLPFLGAVSDLESAWGAFSEYAIVTDHKAYEAGKAPPHSLAQTIVPSDIDPVDAVMIVTFREVLSAIRCFDIKAEDSVAVFGCGPVGLTFIKLLSLFGCRDIVAIDIAEEKLGEAKANGARRVLNGQTVDVTAEIRKDFPDGVRYVLDAVGLPSVINQAMPILADRGSVLCYGVLAKDEITINFSGASYNWNFICQQMPEKAEEAAADEQIIKWIQNGDLVIKDFISDYFSFDDAIQAFDKLLKREILKKGIIKF